MLCPEVGFKRARREGKGKTGATQRRHQTPKFVSKFTCSSWPISPTQLWAGSSSSFCLSVKQMGFLLTPEYCERAGRSQATSSFPLSYPVCLFCTCLFWWRGCSQRVRRRGGSAAGNPSPRRRGPARPRPIPAPIRGAGKGAGEPEPGGGGRRGARGGGEAGSARARPLPRGLQVEPTREPTRQPLPTPPLPGGASQARGCGRGAPGLAAGARARAASPWLRAGGGRTRTTSCASAASSGARAAPGAACSPATRPQVRGSGSARGGTGAPGTRGRARPAPDAGGSLARAEGIRTFNSRRRAGGRLAFLQFPSSLWGRAPGNSRLSLPVRGPGAETTYFPCRLNPGAAGLELVASLSLDESEAGEECPLPIGLPGCRNRV